MYRPNMGRVSFSVTRKIGADEVRITLSGYCQSGDERIELVRLEHEAIDALTDYINEVALDSPANPQASNTADRQRITMVTHLVCTFENKIKKVKAVSPDFPKYGVIVFDEVLAMIGLTKDDISLEHGHTFTPPVRATVLMSEENKPRKVVRLEHMP